VKTRKGGEEEDRNDSTERKDKRQKLRNYKKITSFEYLSKDAGRSVFRERKVNLPANSNKWVTKRCRKRESGNLEKNLGVMSEIRYWAGKG